MPEFKLVKRSGSPRWYIGWSEGHRSRRVPTGTEDREHAAQILHLFALEYDKPVEAKPDEVAIAQILSWYWDERASSLPSAEYAGIAVARFNRFYGLALVSAIDITTNQKYFRERQAAGVSWQTINRERAVLRAALNHARKHHGLVALPHVPMIGASDAAATPVEPKGRPLSIAELASLYAAAKSDHMRMFILVLLGTACRPDAARDLKIAGQLDFEHRRINLNPRGRRQTKKVRPIVPMAKFLSKALKGCGRKYAIEYHGDRVSSVKTAWRLLRRAAGLDAGVNPYSIRHTVSRYLRSKKVPGDQISVMLGHRPQSASRVDLIYAPYEPDYCRDAIRAIEALHREIMREVARQLRATEGVDKMLIKLPTSGKPFINRGRTMVGATGIEPVTPTMSR